MKTYFIYILECADGKLYTGMANNLERRFQEHQNGHDRNAYTFTRRPVKLVFSGEFNDVYFAMDWERRLKKCSAKKKRALIAGDSDLLQILSESHNCTHFEFKPDQRLPDASPALGMPPPQKKSPARINEQGFPSYYKLIYLKTMIWPENSFSSRSCTDLHVRK